MICFILSGLHFSWSLLSRAERKNPFKSNGRCVFIGFSEFWLTFVIFHKPCLAGASFKQVLLGVTVERFSNGINIAQALPLNHAVTVSRFVHRSVPQFTHL